MHHVRTLTIPFLTATLLALGAAGCGGGDDDDDIVDSTLTIDNQSSFTLIGIYLSPTTSVAWGDDLLGADVLDPGESFEISGIACDTYDVRVVDEDSDECIIDSVDLCLDDATWHIDDAELVGCQL